MSLKPRVEAVYQECGRLVGTPYVFSGAHNSRWLPSLDYANGISAPGAGIDCSSGCSIALRAGGLCWSPRPPFPLSTANFIEWGDPGPGELMTLWVRNDSVEQHCGLQFHGFDQEWWQASNPRSGVGWLQLDTAGFQARHWAQT